MPGARIETRNEAWRALTKRLRPLNEAAVESARLRQEFIQSLLSTFRAAGIDLSAVLAKHAKATEEQREKQIALAKAAQAKFIVNPKG